MLKVAIVGCGKIADAHAAQIGRIRDCEIVAVCDRELLMARQLFDRYPAKQCFSELSDLLRNAKPDVVHITTPPSTHFDLARKCLEAGCHVYVEKPFTLFESEAAELIGLANRRGLKLTAGHDDQFSHVARRMRKLVSSGYLGGAPVHIESYYCYELSGSSYATALLGDQQHWVRGLPGKLLQNIISHGIARVVEFLSTDTPSVLAYGFTSPLLASLGETDIIDELRVTIGDGKGATAYFTFSTQMRPALHQLRIYGPKNAIVLDQDQETLIKVRGRRFTSYAEKFFPPAQLACQYLGNLGTNVRKFVASDFHMKSGMKYLIESFYRSIVNNDPLPIPYREILLTARVMDMIFAQISSTSQSRIDMRKEARIGASD